MLAVKVRGRYPVYRHATTLSELIGQLVEGDEIEVGEISVGGNGNWIEAFVNGVDGFIMLSRPYEIMFADVVRKPTWQDALWEAVAQAIREGASYNDLVLCWAKITTRPIDNGG